MSLSSLTWTTFEVVATSSTNAGKSLRIQMSATGLAVDGVPLTGGYQNLYILYPDPDTSLPNATIINLESDGTLDNTPVDIRYGVYPAGSVKIAYSSDGAAPESNVIELPALPLAGGGGGGGGGNNGGSGYNNMATLELAYDGYSGLVSQENIITVLGETRGALTADEVITVEVPLAKFKKVLKYASTWDASLTGDQAGEQPRPRVKFSPTASDSALAELQTMLAGISQKGTGAASGRLWADDANVNHPMFGAILLGLNFTNSALDDDEVPRESIRKIVEGDLTVPAIDTTVTELDSQGAGATLKGQLESLFEQAVNAGRVKTSDDQDGSFKNPSFVEGDTMSFLVKYDFTKTRKYKVDDEVVNPATAARATITVNGQVIQLHDYEETSDADADSTRTYEIKLVAV